MIDVVWVSLAFALGLAARQVGLPPLIGFLAAGFCLHALEVQSGDGLSRLSDLGVTLLLFTIGLKLKVKSLLSPHIWGAGGIHMLATSAFFTVLLMAASTTGIGPLARLSWPTALLIGFALSFSSTVFAVKVLEDRGDVGAIYGLTMIGILVFQDIVAVIFLAASAGKVPSPWAVLVVVGLFPARWLLGQILDRVGHGELVVLFGLSAALGAGAAFEAVSLKGDLGALICGALLAGHRSVDELSKTLLQFKDFFLVAFFLAVGMAGTPTLETALLGAALLLALPLKGLLFVFLLTAFRMRARTSFFSGVGLSNYSEFGLIVVALAASNGWLDPSWLTIIAVALALSFVAASPLNTRVLALYERVRERLKPYQAAQLIEDERQIEPGPAAAIVLGMGRVGSGGYDELEAMGFTPVIGMDSAPSLVEAHRKAGRTVIRASGTDLDFWDRLAMDFHGLKIVLLTMPRVSENIFAAEQLRKRGFAGRISALAKYEDHVKPLRRAGVDRVFNLYREAGAGLADDAVREAG